MYKVAVYKEVYPRAKEKARDPFFFFNELLLPFPPFVGLSLSEGKAKWWCGPLEKVEWSADGEYFICYTKPEDSELDATELVEYMLERFYWRLHGPTCKPSFFK